MASAERARSRSPGRSTKRDRSRRSRSPHGGHRHRHHHSHHHGSRHSPSERQIRPPRGLPDTTDLPLPARPLVLPLRATPLSLHDLPLYRNMFASYLDIQKQRDMDDMDEKEVRGRWKSFIGKWNRGALAEGWYDPATRTKADAMASEMAASTRASSGPTRNVEADNRTADPGDSDSDYGPPPPPSLQAGPATATFSDLAQRDDLSVEQREAETVALRAARKADKKAQREALEDIAPRAAAGTRERQLEKRAEVAASNRSFAASKEADVAEVRDSELLGGGDDDFRRMKQEAERKKSEKEIRREEQLRARAAERDERVRGMKEKEEKTMDMFRGLVKERFGGGA